MAETGHFATLWKQAGRAARARRRVPARRLAPRRRRRRDRGAARRGPRARDQGRAASCTTRPRPASPAAFPTCARAIDRAGHPALLHGRHDLVAGLDRLPPRRMGRRRHRRRLAEGADAAARAVVQRDQRQGARGGEDARSCRARTGTGARCSRPTRAAIFPYTPATNLLYGLPRRSTMLFAEGLDQRVRAPRPATPRRRGARCAPGGSRSCARDPAPNTARSLTR